MPRALDKPVEKHSGFKFFFLNYQIIKLKIFKSSQCIYLDFIFKNVNEINNQN